MSTAKKASAKGANKKAATAPENAIMQVVKANEKKQNEPTMLPPGTDGAMVWNNNVKIVSTWGIAENNNGWLNVSGLGFRKIKETNSQSFLALVMLGAHARDKSSIVNLRTEADNKIYEMYVW